MVSRSTSLCKASDESIIHLLKNVIGFSQLRHLTHYIIIGDEICDRFVGEWDHTTMNTENEMHACMLQHMCGMACGGVRWGGWGALLSPKGSERAIL